MPPTPKLTREELVNAAIELIRETGIEGLNARNLAKRLNLSTNPIFRLYESMDALKRDVYDQAEKIYQEYILDLQDQSLSPFLQTGLNYIRFAYKEKNLFKFIFLSDNIKVQSFHSIADMAEMPEIIDYIASANNISYEQTKKIFTCLWSMTHGISCLIATNDYSMNEDELREILQLSFKGILLELKRGNQ